MASKQSAAELEVGGRKVRLSSPDRVCFPEHGWTKLDVANYYISVGEGVLRALCERPTMLHLIYTPRPEVSDVGLLPAC